MIWYMGTLVHGFVCQAGIHQQQGYPTSDVFGSRTVRWEGKEQWWLLPLPQDSAFTALRGQFDPVVIVRESPGQLQTGEGQPVTVLKRQSGSSHEMAPMAEVLTHRARTAGHCPRQGICERWLHKERGVVELGSFLGPFSIYRYTIYNTQHTLPGQSVTGDDSPFLPISESNPPPAPK